MTRRARPTLARLILGALAHGRRGRDALVLFVVIVLLLRPLALGAAAPPEPDPPALG